MSDNLHVGDKVKWEIGGKEVRGTVISFEFHKEGTAATVRYINDKGYPSERTMPESMFRKVEK